MDKQYIKMADCPEIQDVWEPKEQDMVIALESYNLRQWWKDHINERTYVKGVIGNDVFLGFGPWVNKKSCIFLPSQRQLQDMVVGNDTAWRLTIRFNNFIQYESKYTEITIKKLSMEQLWFSFVMWELYEKRWNKREWVKEG